MIFVTTAALFTVFAANGISANAAYVESNENDGIMISSMKDINLQNDTSAGGSSSNSNSNSNTNSDSNTDIDTDSNSKTYYKETTTEELEIYNGVTISSLVDVQTDRWRVGLIEHWYQYSVTDFELVDGVYSFFPPISKALLESGGASFTYEKSFSATTYTNKVISFSNSIDASVETNFYANIDSTYGDAHASASLSAKAALNCAYSYDYNYNRETLSTQTYTYNFTLSQDSVKYCPDGYNIAIGQTGKYYIGTIKYTEYKNWWGTDYTCSDEVTINFIIASPNQLAYNYVIYEGTNSEGPYYYYCTTEE